MGQNEYSDRIQPFAADIRSVRILSLASYSLKGKWVIQTLTASQFATTFCLRPQKFAWLLGAGASASAGIPTGYAMIQDFRKRLFCQLSGISQRVVDTNDPLWIERIDSVLSTRSELPSPGNPSEYGAAFEVVFPNPEDRRIYIEDAVKKGTPSYGHRVLGSLLSSQNIPCVFTTNFDQLVETASTVAGQLIPADRRAPLTVSAIDNVDRAQLCFRESRWPLLVKLHGDFQSVELKNTTDELRQQDTKLRSVLTAACSRFGLVVVGYSGRDASVMDALTEALEQPNPFPGGIYWTTQSTKTLLARVTEFLEKAEKTGVSVFLVESPTFDELSGDIIDGIDIPDALLNHVNESRPTPILKDAPLPTVEQRKFPVLQCSAVPVLSLPKKALCIEVNDEITTVRARELVRESGVRALVASTGKRIAAFGSNNELVKAFSPVEGRLAGTIALHPEKDSWARGLIYDALTKAVCQGKPLVPLLRRRGHTVIVAKSSPNESRERSEERKALLANLQNAYSTAIVGIVPEKSYTFSEGISIRLDFLAERWWCVFEPITYVDFPRPDGEKEISENNSTESVEVTFRRTNPVADWRRERWAARYNRVWSKVITAWADIISKSDDGGKIHSLGFEGEGLDAEFQISALTGWSRPSHEHDYFLRGGR